MGAMTKEHTLVSWYYPPDSHYHIISLVHYSLKGLKYVFIPINSTSDGLTALRETETE